MPDLIRQFHTIERLVDELVPMVPKAARKLRRLRNAVKRVRTDLEQCQIEHEAEPERERRTGLDWQVPPDARVTNWSNIITRDGWRDPDLE